MAKSVCIFAIAFLLLAAPGCGGGDDDDGGSAGGSETSPPADDAQACDVLTKDQVEQALGIGDLTPVTDGANECAYGTTEDEAQVTFSVAELVGGTTTFEEGLASTKEALGEERVREFSGIAEGAWAVDNGSGSFFAQTFDGTEQISIYIYFDPETPAEEVFAAAEVMLRAAAPNI